MTAGDAMDRQPGEEADPQLQKLQEAVEDNRAAGDRVGEANALFTLARLHRERGQLDGAIAACEQALQLSVELGRQEGVAKCRHLLGYIHHSRGEYDEAEGMWLQALAIRQTLGDVSGMGNCYQNLAVLYDTRLGRPREALEMYEACLVARKETGEPTPEALQRAKDRLVAKLEPERAAEVAAAVEARQPKDVAPGPAETQEAPTARTPAAPEEMGSAGVPLEWQVGDVILVTYEVKEIFTSGGMGLVYRAHHRGWGLDLAVKCPRARYFLTEQHKESFVREAETWVDLGLHPNIVSCYYVRNLGGIPRVFAEYVEGGSLQDWIRGRRLYEGVPERSLERVLDVSIQFAWGLAYAHDQGLVHQDVKPANVMMTPDGEAKVTDFGLAKARAGTGERAGAGPGKSILVSSGGMTPAYCSPEQATGGKLTRRTDIWSWGLSVLEMFVGELTWLSGVAAPSALESFVEEGAGVEGLPAMPAAVVNLLRQCFQEELEARPKDMLEVAERLREVYEQEVGQPYARQRPEAAELRADSLSNRAVSFLDLGREGEATAAWEEALRADSLHPEVTYNLGLWRWRSAQQPDDMDLVRQLQRVADTRPGDWRPLHLLGQVHLERGDGEAAEETLNAAIQLAPDEAEIQGALQRVPEAPTAHSRCIADGHEGDVNALAFTPDGQRLVSAGGKKNLSEGVDSTLRLWDLVSRSWLRTFEGHERSVRSVAVTPDGLHAVSGSADNTARLWDLDSGKCLRTFQGHAGPLNAVTITADGRQAVSGSSDQTLRVWDLASGRCQRTLEGHEAAVTSVALSADGQYAVSGSHDKTLRVWDLASGAFVRSLEGHEGAVTAVALARDGRHAVSGGRDKTLRLWDLKSGECQRIFEGQELWVNALAITPDGRRVLSGAGGGGSLGFRKWGLLRLYDLESGNCLRTLEGHGNQVLAVAIAPDGRHAASGSGEHPSVDYTVRLWDLESGRCLHVYPGSARKLAVAVTPGGRHAVWRAGYGAFHLLDIESGECLRAVNSPEGLFGPAALTPDGRSALIALGQRTEHSLVLWDLASGRLLRSFRSLQPIHSIDSLDVTPDGRYGVSRSGGSIRLWELDTGKCLRVIKAHDDQMRALAITPDGRFAVSGGKGKGSLHLWELVTGKRLRTFEGHTSWPDSIAFTPDGRHLVSSAQDKTIRIWNLETGVCLRVLRPFEYVFSLTVTPDGRHIVSSCTDRTVRMWDADNGRCLRTFGHQRFKEGDVSITQGGDYVVAGGRTVWVWPLRAVGSQTADWALSRPRGAREAERLAALVQSEMETARAALARAQFAEAAAALRQVHSLPGYERDPDVMKLWHRAGLEGGRRAGLRGAHCQRVLEAHSSKVEALAVARLGRRAMSVGGDETARLWDLRTGECLRSLEGVRTPVAITPDGRYILSRGQGYSLNLWDLASGTCLRTMQGHKGEIEAMAITPDGYYALSGGGYKDDHSLRLWDPESGECLRILKGHRDKVLCAVLSSNGRYAVSGSKDETLRVWRLDSGRRSRALKGHNAQVKAIYLTRDEERIVSSAGASLRVWEVATGRLLHLFEDAWDPVAFTPDGQFMVSSGRSGTVHLWDLRSGECLRTLRGHEWSVLGLTVTPDGRYAVSGAERGRPGSAQDNTVRIWDLQSGECLSILWGHKDDVNTVAVTPDGRHVVSGSDDGTLRLWDLDWEYDFPEPVDWDEGASPYLERFLSLHTPPERGLFRREKPDWTDDDFQQLLTRLQHCGYGWLRPEGVQRKLEEMVGG